MSEFFLTVVNMSISASWIVLAVLLLRLLFKKAPKWITVLLWGIVAVRLICPFTIESVMSLIPSAETISPEIMMDETPEINTGSPIINHTINPVIGGSLSPDPAASVNPLQILIPILSGVWIAGIVLLLAYTAITYWRLRRKVGTAVLLCDNIFQSECVVSPFVLGIIRPRIYLPFKIDGQDMEHVIAHEQAHIRRKDHWWKPFGFLLLTLHWFNPLMWLGYVLLCRDIELACDEKVVKELNTAQRADYSQALLTCSVNRRMIAACPLAFGEVGVKSRVKSVLNYKKPAFGIILVAIIVSAVVAVCFLTNPRTSLNAELSVFIDGQIMEHHSSNVEGYFSAIDYKVLDVDASLNETTVYMWVLYQEYSHENGDIKVESGAHIPTVITAKRTGSHGHYELVEYWEPRDGSYYADDIREKFPWYLHIKALDSQRYIDEQLDSCENAAKEYFSSTSNVGGADGPVNVITSANMEQLKAKFPMYFDLEWSPIIDTATFDIDGDGKDEQCTLSFGPTSGLFTFKLSVWEIGSQNSRFEYFNIFNGREGEMSFIETDDGVKIHLVPQGESKSIDYTFSIKDGNIVLTADGENLEYWGEQGVESAYSGVQMNENGEIIYAESYPNYVEMYEQTPADQVEEKYDSEQFVITKQHYKTEDGLWMADGYTYKYRLEITGRMRNAAKNTTYIVLSNTKDITFEQTWKASGFSSLLTDYFDPSVAMIVGNKLFS